MDVFELKVVSEDGCVLEVSESIMIYPEVISDFYIIDNKGCNNELETGFLNYSLGASTFNWDFGEFGTSIQPEPIITFIGTENAIDTFPVTLTAHNNYNCTDDTTQFIYIYDSPETQADFNYSRDGFDISFQNLSINGDTFQWEFGDSTINFDENPIHMYDSAGEYEAKLISYNICDADSITKLVNVYPLSILQKEHKNIYNIYPNPFYDQISIESNFRFEKILITDISGKTIKKTTNLHSSRLDLNYLKSGIYTIHLYLKDGFIVRKTIIKY